MWDAPTSNAASGSPTPSWMWSPAYWIGFLLTTEMTSSQVQVLFHQALEDQGRIDGFTGELLGSDGRPLQRDEDGPPILVAWSDNGPEMTSTDTRQFMALVVPSPSTRPPRNAPLNRLMLRGRCSPGRCSECKRGL